MAEIGKVFAVDDVLVYITRTEPPWMIIHAIGRAATTGWSNGQLAKHIHITPPADGIQGFEFNAQMPAPDDVTLDVLTPISAHAEFSGIDVANYWGKGVPLKGIRVHAVSNSKCVDVVSRADAHAASVKMSPQATVSYVGGTAQQDVPGFEEDIRPLFRPRDINSMRNVAGFDLSKYEDVKVNADKIAERLRVNMPCDGLWPEDDIKKFEAWKAGGMPA
ncbi:MAG TPA: hypothetical protein VF601_06490 [Beijerinckiaceae bacterium]|jgi:hypothetical protein